MNALALPELVDRYRPTSLAGRRLFAWQRYIPHAPHPKQAEFLALDADEALFGGAAGGGKSDALLMDALRDVGTPGYSAILFRRSHKDLALPEGLIPRSHEWLGGTDAHWDGVQKEWRFPSGAVVAFGYIDDEKDRYRYQSAAFQFIGWDELTQFQETWYRYLFSRLRRVTSVDVPLRMRGASNPGGIGHQWVMGRFVDPPNPARPFIPSLAHDNPTLDQTTYTRSLSQLDAVTRRQLEEGSWVQDASGLLYPEFVEAQHVIDRAPDGITNIVIGLDFGFVDANAIAVLGWRPYDRTVYVLRAYEVHGLPERVAVDVRELMERYQPGRIVGDLGGLGKGYAEALRQHHNIPVEAAQKADKMGNVRLLNGALGRGQVKVVRAGCADLIRQWRMLPKNERGEEIGGFENHAADAVLYAWRECGAYAEEPAPAARQAENLPADWRRAWKAEAEGFEDRMMAQRDKEITRAKTEANEWD